MELTKTKYKQTEVGLIPEDWEVLALSHVLNRIADVDHYMPKTEKYGVPYVMTGDLKEQVGDIDFENCKKISSTAYKKLSKKVKNVKGDIILARYATVGTVSFVDIDYDFIVSYSCVTIKPDTSKLFGLFLYYYFKSSIFKLEVKNKVNANIQDNVGIGDLVKMKIPSPPTLAEQKAIATALSDVDKLIANLDKLIIKKKAIKQGAMQQLFTPPDKGGKRLPGYSGEWEEKTLRGCLKYEQPTKYLVHSSDYEGQSQTPVLTAGKSFLLGYTDEYFGVFEDLPVIIFDDFTTSKQFVNFQFKVKSSAMKMLKPLNDGIDLTFMHALMSLIRFSLGDDHKRRWITEYSQIEVFIPDLNEQKAIAQILSDMDAEIKALDAKKEKYQGIKQGMMQELLTGKTRLV